MQTPGVDPPRILPESLDRRLYLKIHGLPHSPVGDRYVTILSDLGEGLGWVAAGAALAWIGGSKGRRAGVAAVVASPCTTDPGVQGIQTGFKTHPPLLWRDRVLGRVPTASAS